MGEDDRSRWLGPPGWLEPLPAGALLAVRVRPDGEVVLTVLDAEPTASDTLVASVRAAYEKVWINDPASGTRRDLAMEEDLAFWAWATIEVLRTTGIRIEELLEITHHSLVQYRLPSTGELIPLLQIAPSKTDAERLLVVSPELADVLSTIICRVRNDTTEAIPVISAYDRTECVWLPPAPWLFQRRLGTEHRRICPGAIRSASTTPQRGIPRPDRRRMDRVPRPLRTPQGLDRNLQPRVRHPVHPRTRLHPLLPALARPRPARAAHRDPRQPHRRIAEAQREGWLGEVEGLKISLAGAEDKLAQIDRRSPRRATVDLGIPAPTPSP